MTEGPFRDTLTPLIEDARRQLGELQRQREALEVRYEAARKRLDAKIEPQPGVFRTPFILGLIVGLLTWFRIFSTPSPG